MPLFTIIIPTFNPGEKLALSLESVRSQNFDSLEIWVMDGASTDGTAQSLEHNSAAPGVHWQSEPDAGVYDAMNKGIARARGRYLYFLGAGDTLRPRALETIAAHLPDHNRGLLYGRVWIEEHAFDYGAEFTRFHIARANLSHQGIFYGREIFEKIGLYDLRYPIGADHVMNIRIFADASIEKRFVDFTLAQFERGGLSSTQSDPAYQRDLPRLVRSELGALIYMMWRLARAAPMPVVRSVGTLRRALKWVLSARRH